MIIAERKPLPEIVDKLKRYRKILNIGCGGCVSICLAGGQKEAYELNVELAEAFGLQDLPIQLDTLTIERQCNVGFFEPLDQVAREYECLLTMACGAGVQFVADRFQEIPVFPAVNTVFVGVDRDLGWYEENCRTCGECVLGETGGVCPLTRCSKSLFNGPCGGTRHDGACEVATDIPCAWFEIHRRLKLQGRLEEITKIRPARDWENQTVRHLIQPSCQKRYLK